MTRTSRTGRMARGNVSSLRWYEAPFTFTRRLLFSLNDAAMVGWEPAPAMEMSRDGVLRNRNSGQYIQYKYVLLGYSAIFCMINMSLNKRYNNN